MSRVLKITKPDGIYFITCTVTGWVDIFSRIHYRKIIIDSLNFCRKEKGLRIHAYVIMSNHIHLVVSRTGTESTLSDIIRDFKKFTSRQIINAIKLLPESRKEWMLTIFSNAGRGNANNKYYQFWQQDNHPIELKSTKFLEQKIYYIHQNPVRAGVVLSAEDYLFSSANDYRGKSSESILEIDMLEW